LSLTGHCYSSRYNKLQPIPFPKGEIFIIQISSGGSHILALSSCGSCFSWGANNFGQLGISDDLPDMKNPTLIESLEGKKVVFLGTGSSHSLAIAEAGKLCYCWGWNGTGRPDYFGCPPKSELNLISIFESEMNEQCFNLQFVSIHGGNSCSMVITKDGKCFHWKNNRYNPKRIGGVLFDKFIKWGCICGEEYMIITMNGDCFGWSRQSDKIFKINSP